MDFNELEKISNNPSRVITKVFSDIEKTFLSGEGGLNSTDHPFAYLVDLVVGTNYGFISRLGDSEARNFEVHARNISDLSKRMSDADWDGVRTDPSTTVVRFIISGETIKRFSSRFNSRDGNLDNSYKLLVIPPDTKITVGGVPFLLENPVEIRAMDHGGYQVVYDSARQSPLNPLTTNTPDTRVLRINGTEYLAIELPVRQLDVIEFGSRSVNLMSGYRETISFNDNLYAVRAFIVPEGGTQRKELAVVFNNEIFDPNQPTLTIDMETNNSFTASIPSVYIQNRMGVGRLTILVYTSKGKMYRNLSTLNNGYHNVEYFDYANDKGVLTGYEKPFKNIDDVMVDSIAPITGGRDAISFQQLKDLIIYGHRRRLIPISDNDISQFLITNGYSSVKSVDYVTGRLYRVTKDLPLQDDKLYQDDTATRINSSIGTHIGSIMTSMEEIIGTGWGIDNGRRVTIPAKTIFNVTKQTPYITSKNDINIFMGSSNQNKIDVMGRESMVYTPFDYVIDTTRDRASIRTYLLRKPTIKYQTFRYENVNLGVQVSVGAINIKVSDNGYKIEILTSSSEAYKKIDDNSVGVQLSMTPLGSNSPITTRAKFLGKTKEGERIFEFTLDSRFDINDTDQIDFNGFNQFGKPLNGARVPLSTIGNFIFTYMGDGQQLLSASDMKVDQSLFPALAVSMIETEYVIEFGRPLKSLYTRIRPMVGEAMYKKYEFDVPDVYTENVFKYENGELVVVDGKAVLLHRVGEVRLDSNGKPVIRFVKGQTVFDDEGNPVLLEARKLKYYLDFIGFDYSYLVSQDEYDTQYAARVEDFFIDEVVGQLDKFNTITLDETRMVFKPRSTMSHSNVIINSAVERTLKTDLSFDIVYYLTEEGLNNQNLKDNLINTTHKEINNLLKPNVVSVSSIVASLKSLGGEQVLDVNVKMLAGSTMLDVISNIDDTNGFSVRKLIDQTADKFLTIKEDIEIQFRRHYQQNS